VRDDFAVDKVLLEPDMAPYGLHLPQAQSVVLVMDPDSGKLLRDASAYGLKKVSLKIKKMKFPIDHTHFKPRYDRFISFQVFYHILRIRRPGERPWYPRLDDVVARQVYEPHGRCVGMI